MQENTENILSINQRIFKFIDYLKLTRYKFSKNTGISESVLLNIHKAKNKPSVDLLEKILNTYPVLNSNWLLTGEGSMILAEKKTYSDVEDQDPSNSEVRNLEFVYCIHCKEKERTISALEKTVSSLEKVIREMEKDHGEQRASAAKKTPYKKTA
jgi:transcriptional regulator with XRE-family HTH domain